jgi:hypothetical protein
MSEQRVFTLEEFVQAQRAAFYEGVKYGNENGPFGHAQRARELYPLTQLRVLSIGPVQFRLVDGMLQSKKETSTLWTPYHSPSLAKIIAELIQNPTEEI